MKASPTNLQVVLTDYEPKVLLNLRASAAANAATPVFPPAAVAQNSNGGAGPLNGEVTTEVDKSHAAETTQDAAQPSWDLVRPSCLVTQHLDYPPPPPRVACTFACLE